MCNDNGTLMKVLSFKKKNLNDYNKIPTYKELVNSELVFGNKYNLIVRLRNRVWTEDIDFRVISTQLLQLMKYSKQDPK